MAIALQDKSEIDAYVKCLKRRATTFRHFMCMIELAQIIVARPLQFDTKTDVYCYYKFYSYNLFIIYSKIKIARLCSFD